VPRDPIDAEAIYRDFLDHPTFARESLVIADEQGLVVPMELQPAQLRLNEAIEEQRRNQQPIRIVYLKARRVMVSSGTAAQIYHQTAFRGGQHAAVVAHDEDTAINLLNFYRGFANGYKPFRGAIRAPRIVKSPEGLIEWENGSWIKVGTARNLQFGRSYNLRRVQLDEYAFYPDPGALTAAVMAAVPKDADTMVVVPSTANGIGNGFHNLWLRATDPATRSEWKGVFFGWWEHPANRLPLPYDARRFEASLDAEEREIRARFRLSLEQLAWRRWVIDNDMGGDVERFHQEHPSHPDEAFIATGRMRFDLASISRQPVQRDGTQGALEVVEQGLGKLIVFTPRAHGELTVWRRPVPGREYIIGADPAWGRDASLDATASDPDFSVGQVLDRDTGEQVAMLRARLRPAAFGEYLDSLGRWYNLAGIVPEVTGVGIGTLDELMRLGYPAQRIFHRRREPDRDPWERSDLAGWQTTTVTREQLISKLDSALRMGAVSIHDPVTSTELMSFVIHPNGKSSAAQGSHDDTVIALALAVVGIEQMPRLKNEMKRSPHGNDAKDRDRRGRLVRLIRG
jgi:hypothetical protein